MVVDLAVEEVADPPTLTYNAKFAPSLAILHYSAGTCLTISSSLLVQAMCNHSGRVLMPITLKHHLKLLLMPYVWSRPPAVSPYPPNITQPPSTFVANALPSTSGSWFPNSGASCHVTSDAKNLQQVTPFEGHDQIFIGNGQDLAIQSAGSSSFPSPFHPTTHTPPEWCH